MESVSVDKDASLRVLKVHTRLGDVASVMLRRVEEGGGLLTSLKDESHSGSVVRSSKRREGVYRGRGKGKGVVVGG